MSAPLADAAVVAVTGIGRYFSVVSVLPTVLTTAYVYVLMSSGAWSHPPDFSQSASTVSSLSIAGIIALVLVALVLALAVHGMQFGLVQFFEGYWSGGRIVERIRTRRTMVHVTRYQRAFEEHEAAHTQLVTADEDDDEARFRAMTAASTAQAIVEGYPDLDHIMPTRLGNMMRRHEDLAGSAYGLSILQVAPHLLLLADEKHAGYVNDQRSQLDLSVRISASAVVAAAFTTVVMWPWGAWLLLALVPYAVAYLAYRSSITCARHYGIALRTVTDLARFRLYTHLHMPAPSTAEHERAQNKILAGMLGGSPDDILYKH